MKDERFFSKINVRIATAFLAISIAIVLVLSTVLYYQVSDIISENRKKQTEDSIEQTSNFIASYVDKIKILSDLISMYPDTLKAVKNIDSASVEALTAMVGISAKSDERIRTVAVISKNGFAITSNNNMAVPLSQNMMEEEWYRAAVSSKQMPVITSVYHEPFNKEEGDRVISISHEIVGEGGEHLGVVLIDVSYKFIEDYLSSLRLGDKGYAYIVDANDMILYHPDESVFMDEEKIKTLIEDSAATMTMDDLIITKEKVPHSNWILVGVSSMEDVEVLKEKLMNILLFSALVLLGISAVISLRISKKLTEPIIELKNAMISLDESWSHLSINEKSPSEIRTLTREYNALIDRIKQLTQDIASKENAKRLFELKALQSQINPHFLYNTLDTILWLAEFGENRKAVQVSKALGEMLRMSLHINQTVVPLKDELNHAENYLKIQQTRYEDKLSYRMEGEEDLLEVPVPKLILQPVVENSIYHGIRPKKESGTVEISYRREGDFLIIEVEDDGIGYKEAKARDENRVKTKLGGIGMKNVDQRIKLLLGEDSGIEIQGGREGGTLVTYRLKIGADLREEES
ncbi:MAG: sensor histidine kinase [Filifactor alocis]|nr:sensor histidine kinase [Filifactor alocis]